MHDRLGALTKNRVNYRPDIDGLRAVAVLSVVFYHLNVSPFGGGFVGVDVFFVISGYLITRLIVDELTAGTFSFRQFYLRRARRILPALFFTLACSFAAAFLLFSPQDMQAFAVSLVAAALSVSNVYFWLHTSYFDAAADVSPLLHTWSLGVEEQFYLLYPLVLFLVGKFRPNYVLPTIVGIALLSFVANLIFQDGQITGLDRVPAVAALFSEGQKTIFYLAPFRLFEFAFGAVLAFLPLPKSKWLSSLAFIIGAALLTWAILSLHSGSLIPSWNAIPVCLGAAAIIWSGSSPLTQVLLGNPIAVRVGRISYSLYLAHWPILVFWTYIYGPPTTPAVLGILATSLVIATTMFFLIEQPFRKLGNYRLPRFKAGAFVALAAAILLCCVSFATTLDGGAPWRLNPDAAAIKSEWTDRGAIMGSIGCDSKPCEFGNLQSKTVVLIIGDSHADQYTKALNQLYGKDVHFELAEASSCYIGANLVSDRPGFSNEPCRQANIQAKKWLAAGNVSAVIHGQAWYGYYDHLSGADGTKLETKELSALFKYEIDDQLALFTNYSGPVVLVGASMTSNTKCYTKPTFFHLECPIDQGYYNYVQDWARQARSFAAEHSQFHITIPSETICPQGKCRLIDDKGEVLYTDNQHLSVYGGIVIAPQIMNAVARGDR